MQIKVLAWAMTPGTTTNSRETPKALARNTREEKK